MLPSRDVAPEGVFQAASLERLPVQRQRLLQPLEWNDEVAGCFLDVGMHAGLGGGDERVHPGGHRFAQFKQAGRSALVAGQRQLRVGVDATGVKHRIHVL